MTTLTEELSQAERIAMGRRACPTEYSDMEYGVVPKFLIQAIREWIKREHGHCPRGYESATVVRDHLGSLMDHYGAAIYSWNGFDNGKDVRKSTPCFVCQPYDYFTNDCAQQCQKLADLLRLKWRVFPASQWFPGRTYSLMFTVD